MNRWILLVIPVGVLACGSAPPPVTVPVTPEPPVPIVAEPIAPKEKPDRAIAADPSRLMGAWKWSGDVEVFLDHGMGSYYRDREICYQFMYTIEGDVLTKMADRDSGCQGKRENSYRFHFEGSTLVLRHVGSNFETRWEPTEQP